MTDQNDDGQTPPAGGDQSVTLTKAEFDRLQAENRRAAKERREREAADAANTARAEREAADANALRAQLAERDRRDSLRDAIAERQLTPSQSKLVLRLADLADAGFDAAAHIDAVAAEYEDIFTASTTPPEPTESRVTPQPPMRRAGPVPPAKKSNIPFEGYISPEEYRNYPQKVRLSKQFRERVELSRPYWPDTFNPHVFRNNND